MGTLDITNLTVKKFYDFVGTRIFTVEFFKKPETPEEIAAGRGEYRKLNAHLKVAKYVKGTAPEATAKRKTTNTAKNQAGVYEMRGTSDRVEEGTPDDAQFQAKNYRTIPLSIDRLISVTVGGIRYENPYIER
jgi:hypothetical protein